MNNDRHLGIRLPWETHCKLRSIADYESRSITGQLLHLVRQCIQTHEARHGEIPLPHGPKE